MAHSGTEKQVLTARDAGVLGCGTCGRVSLIGTKICPRCETPLHSRRPGSIEKVWAWWLAGIFAYVPANLYPMLRTSFLGREQDSTIVGGVVDLIHHGSFLIAAIVFFASVIIPVSKFFAVGYLAWTIRGRTRIDEHRRTVLYEVVEFVGRWSMIDVFVVAVLAALVNLGFVVNFKPGIAAVFFALSVAFTMISALSLDPRLIWDSSTGDGASDE